MIKAVVITKTIDNLKSVAVTTKITLKHHKVQKSLFHKVFFRKPITEL